MKHMKRRVFLQRSAAFAVSVPLVALTARPARADAHDRVDPGEAQAKALSYAHQAPDAAMICANCGLYNGAKGDEWGPCAIFPGRQVAAAGWRSAWVKQPG